MEKSDESKEGIHHGKDVMESIPSNDESLNSALEKLSVNQSLDA